MAKDKTPSDVTKMIKDHEVKLVDFKFTDLPGTWQHFTTTLSDYSDDIFTDGLGFDGSSIRCWKVINASDMRFIYSGNSSVHLVDSGEGHWNSAREEFPNIGYKIRPKEGYFPVPPMDTLQDLRSEMALELEKAGVPVDKQHHEVATAGQAEIDVRFAPLKQMSDSMQYYKYIIRNVARRHNKTVTFMAKPLFADNGSGMHTHISLCKDGKPLFAGNGYASLSEMALFFIGGILKHATPLTCFTNPTTNSFKRLVPGFDAPVNLAYSARK